MFDNSRDVLFPTALIGAAVAALATFLPWYSFEVVIPVARGAHIFAVTTTLWSFTTLAPILIVVAAAVAMLVATLAPRPLANAIVGLIGVGLLAYGIVRWINIPNLGVEIVSGLPAITQLEGGPFIELTGGLLLVLGALGDLLAAPAGALSRPSFSGWRAGSSVPPPGATA
jgi:small-conductance mechanosensitive channel